MVYFSQQQQKGSEQMDTNQMGHFIKERRTQLGLTQEALGKRLNVTGKAVSRWERGVGFPDIQLMEPLAKALGVSVSQLMGGEDAARPDASAEQKLRKRYVLLAILALVCYGILFFAYRQPGLSGYATILGWAERICLLLVVGIVLLASWKEGAHGSGR